MLAVNLLFTLPPFGLQIAFNIRRVHEVYTMKRNFSIILPIVFAICSILTPYSHGQATSGDIAGTVRDATGALLPNATVTIKAESTGVSSTATTTSSGEF